MKKISALLLALILVVSLAACGGGGGSTDLFARYEASVKKSQEIKAMEVVMDMKMNISAEGENLDVDVTMSQKQLIGDKTQAIMVMDMPAAGMKNVKVYLPGDDYMYYDMPGQQFKAKAGIEEMLKQIESNSTGIEFGKNDMSKAESEELENGNTKITFHLKDSMADRIMSEALSSIGNALPDGEGIDMTAKNIVYTLELDKEDNMQAFSMNMDMEITMNEQTAQTSIEMDADVISINAFDTLDFPADLEDYQEAVV